MKNITFFVTRSEDNYFIASAQEESIVTQAKTLDDLIKNIEEAISLHLEYFYCF
jgi:predicted RNase H-like HicB family nuclease